MLEDGETLGRPGPGGSPGLTRAAGYTPTRRPESISPGGVVARLGSEATPDFSQIDFARLWSGREKVTEVEGAIIALALARAPPGRALEVGSGAGRLTPYVARWSPDVVASDATLPLLEQRAASSSTGPPLVAANVYQLPFSDGVFAAVTLVRVFGFLTDPSAALREIHRVLCPGGVLILSHQPHPTVSSLLDDLKVAAVRPRGEPMKTMTFSRQQVAPVRPSSYPAWSHSRAHVLSLTRASGFYLEVEYPCGLEDFFGLRRLPTSVFLSLTRALAGLGGFPTRFLVLRKIGRGRS
jgi:SAM-dependent methyltransferase